MSGIMKTVLISMEYSTCHFSKKIHGSFSQSITSSLSSCSLLTHLACVLLAGCQLLSLHRTASQDCPAKKMTSFSANNASLCDPPHPPALWPLGPSSVPASSQHPGLSATTLLGRSFPWISSAEKDGQKSFAAILTLFS